MGRRQAGNDLDQRERGCRRTESCAHRDPILVSGRQDDVGRIRPRIESGNRHGVRKEVGAMRHSWIAILLVLVVGAVTGFYFLRNNERPPVAAGARAVHPEWRMVGTTVNATGTVRLRVGSEVRVGSQLSGIVKKLNVTVGSHLRAWASIAEIARAPIQARLAH